jgi:hypothetical protein
MIMVICFYICIAYSFIVNWLLPNNFLQNAFLLLPLVSLFFIIMAMRKIKADEKLVKSWDRIR